MVPTITSEFVTKGHGRLVHYTFHTTTACNTYLEQDLTWPKVGQTFCVDRHAICLKTGEISTSRHYGLTDLTPDQAPPRTLFQLWHQHWHIENKLHWVRDVVFGEDLSQARSGSLPFTFSLLRNAVISLLRLYDYPSIAKARAHFSANIHQACSFVGFSLE